jgi:hypothetical protein
VSSAYYVPGLRVMGIMWIVAATFVLIVSLLALRSR